MARQRHVKLSPVCSLKTKLERFIKRTTKEGGIKKKPLRLRIRIMSESCAELRDSFLIRFAVEGVQDHSHLHSCARGVRVRRNPHHHDFAFNLIDRKPVIS